MIYFLCSVVAKTLRKKIMEEQEISQDVLQEETNVADKSVAMECRKLLSPCSIEAEDTSHLAVDDLRFALEQANSRNIAVTGHYGSGKSSVANTCIEEMGIGGEVLRISMSTFSLHDDKKPQGGEQSSDEIEYKISHRYLKYKSFFKEEANQQFNHFDGNVGFGYPTNKFNAVYLMMHISRHIFQEGIGLRQLMDYYFVLIHLLDQEREWAYGKLKWLGLRKLTSAVMYVMKTVFQMDDKYLLCKPSEKIGVYLLEDVFQGGNLGRFGEQYKASYSDNDIILYLKNLKRLRKVYSFCPSEVFWAPVWKLSIGSGGNGMVTFDHII